MRKLIALIPFTILGIIQFSGGKKFVNHDLHRDSTVVSNCRTPLFLLQIGLISSLEYECSTK
jgi:hypothetical protein